jgi:c-di-GMP-binding flagellar brake protein YcgR
VRKKKDQARPPQEQRREARVNEEDKVSVEWLPEGGRATASLAINALTRDISPGGARIMSNVQIPEGDRLRLEIVLSRRRRLIRVDGIVRWSRSIYEEDLFEMGVEFTGLKPEDRMSLLEHVYRRRG